MWGHLRIAHKETHSVNNTCHSFPCSSLNSASLLLFVSSILLQVKIRISKVVFFAWRITQTCQSQSPRHFSVNSMFTAQFYRVIRCLRPFTETIGQGRIGKDGLRTLQLKVSVKYDTYQVSCLLQAPSLISGRPCTLIMKRYYPRPLLRVLKHVLLLLFDLQTRLHPT